MALKSSTKKRICSLLLTGVMLVSMVPLSVFAEEVESDPVIVAETGVTENVVDETEPTTTPSTDSIMGETTEETQAPELEETYEEISEVDSEITSEGNAEQPETSITFDASVVSEFSEPETSVEINTIVLTLILPDGFTADDVQKKDDGTLYVQSKVGEDGTITPIQIIPADEDSAGSFNMEIATLLSKNALFIENNLTASYDESTDTLTITGAPTQSMELDMNDILIDAMEEMDAYDTEAAEEHEHQNHCICGDHNINGCNNTSITWTAWTASNCLPTNRGNYYLTKNVTLSTTWKCKANINLCLNGFTISKKSDAVDILVSAVDELAITDCQNNAGQITVQAVGGGNGITNEGSLTIWNGTISGNCNGVYNNGSFTMKGGEITGNSHGVVTLKDVKLSGKVTISDNMYEGEKNNLLLLFRNNEPKITVEDKLDEKSRVGINFVADQFRSSVTVVSNSQDTSIFTCDNKDYEIAVSEDSLVLLATEHKHCVCGDHNTKGCDDTSITWTPWTSYDSLPTESGNYYLTEYVTLTSTWTCNADIRLCLNDKAIEGKRTGAVICVEENSSLTITSCATYGGDVDFVGWITGGKNGVENKGTFTLWNGMITEAGKNTTGDGGGVYNQSTGTFNMYGGEICWNTAQNGGGVYIDGGIFNMYGGYIEYNSVNESGGGVYNDGGTFIIYDGTIKHNSGGNYGGGIFNNATMTITNGEISDNASSYGGGIYNNGSLTMKNGEVKENTATMYGGGVYNGDSVSGEGRSFIMTGGSISKNTAKYSGGGVYNGEGLYDSTYTMSGDSRIEGNTVTNAFGKGGGVYNSGSFFMKNGNVEGNSAYYGGGVYGDLWASGSPKITGNVSGGNVYGCIGVEDEAPLALDANIGITAKIGSYSYPTVVKGTTSSTGFFSDNPEYRLVSDGTDGLKLMDVPVTIEGVTLQGGGTDLTDGAMVYNGHTVSYTYGTYTPSTVEGAKISYTWQKKTGTDESGQAIYKDWSTLSWGPSDVGEYRLLVMAKKYGEILGTKSLPFKITEKVLTIKNIEVEDKYYDGTNIAHFKTTPQLDGIVGRDYVRLHKGTPTFTSVVAGENIPIAFVDFCLSYTDDASNYTLIQPTGITASIKSYTVTGDEYSVTRANTEGWINTDFVVTAKDGWELSTTNTAEGVWTDTLTSSEETDSGSLTFYVKYKNTGVISEGVPVSYKIDKTFPVITPTKTAYCSATELTITDDYLDAVTVNGKTATLTGDKLKLSPVAGTQTVTARDKAGNEKSLTVTVNNGHTWGAWTIVSQATVFTPAVQTHTCTVCKHKETCKTGKALTPTIQVNDNPVVLKVKQKTSAFKVTGLARGDSVVSYASDNSNIFTVDKKGVITAGKTAGTATLTITLVSGYKKKVTVKVQKSNVTTSKITGLQTKVALKKGATLTLKPSLVPITSQDKITYSSSNKKVATVSSKGVLKGVKAGKAKITVKAGKKSFTCKVTVTGVKTTKISGVKATATIKKGKTLKLNAKVVPSNSDEKITYTSSNKKVATVSSKGVVKGVKKGTAVITVKSGSKKVTCKVTVK